MFENTFKNINTEKLVLQQLRKNYAGDFKPGVSIIVPTFKSRYISNIFENYASSSYPLKELILILNNNKLDLAKYYSWASEFENIKMFQLDEKYTLGECLNFGIDNSKYNYISKMDDDDYYAPNYLTDLMNVFNYTDAQVTGKQHIFVYFEDNSSIYMFNHINRVMGATLLFKKDVFQKIRFRKLNFKEDFYFISDCINAGIKIYPSDRYNYIYIRHSNLRDHTLKMSSDVFIETFNPQKVLTVKDFSSFVTG